MKKAVLGMIVVTMIGVLIACSSEDEPKEGTSSNPTEAVSQTGNDVEEDTTEKPTESENELTDEYLLSLPETPADNFLYEETETGDIRIIAYMGETGADAMLVIPSQIDGKDVVEIGKGTFRRFYGKAVVTGKNVKYIGVEAFSACTVDKVLINGPVTKIDEEAFHIADMKEVVLPETLEEIGSLAFSATSLLTTIEIPSSVKNIGLGAFSLSKLEEVTFKGGNGKIEGTAFGSCNYLEKVYIPDCELVFDEKAFYSSENVTIITPAGSAAEEFAKANGIKVENN